LKFTHLVLAKAPLPEEAIFNRKKAAAERRRAARKAQHKEHQITKRDRNNNRIKRRKVGSVASPPMKTRRRSRRGAATCQARRWTGAICRGRPRCRLPVPLKCRHRDGHRRPRATRMWARARDKLPAKPEWTSGWSALTWRPAGRAPPSCREPRLAKLTPPRQSEERSTPVLQLYDGSDRPDSDSLQRRRLRAKSTDSRRCRGCCRRWILAPPRDACSRYLFGVAGPRRSCFRGQGPTPTVAEAGGSAPERSGGGGAFPPLRRRIGVEQPPSWWAPSVQPPSRAHRAARRRSPRCYPKCNLLSSELPS
jgi:hypothetical protein